MIRIGDPNNKQIRFDENTPCVGIIGEIASGKTEAAEFLVNFGKRYFSLYSIYHLSYSIMLDKALLGLNINNPSRKLKQNLAIFLEDTLPSEGLSLTDCVYTQLLNVIYIAGVVVSGIRMPHQLERWQALIPHFKSVYIEVSEEIRHTRENGRREKAFLSPISLEEFKALHNSDTETGISSMKNKADIVINNERSLEEFHAQIIQLIPHYAKEYERK